MFVIIHPLRISWQEISIARSKQPKKKQIGKIFVCDDRGMLIGLASKTDIMNIESERQEYVQQVRKSATP